MVVVFMVVVVVKGAVEAEVAVAGVGYPAGRLGLPWR